MGPLTPPEWVTELTHPLTPVLRVPSSPQPCLWGTFSR